MGKKQAVLVTKKAIDTAQVQANPNCIEDWARFVGVEIAIGGYVQRQARKANLTLRAHDYGGFDEEVERFAQWATLTIYAAIRSGHHRAWQMATQGDARLAALTADLDVGEQWDGDNRRGSVDERLVDQVTLYEAIDQFPPGLGHRLRWLAGAERHLAFWVEQKINEFGGLALGTNGVPNDVIDEVEDRLEELFAVMVEAMRRAHFKRWRGISVGFKIIELDPGLVERVRGGEGRAT